MTHQDNEKRLQFEQGRAALLEDFPEAKKFIEKYTRKYDEHFSKNFMLMRYLLQNPERIVFVQRDCCSIVIHLPTTGTNIECRGVHEQMICEWMVRSRRDAFRFDYQWWKICLTHPAGIKFWRRVERAFLALDMKTWDRETQWQHLPTELQEMVMEKARQPPHPIVTP